MKCGIYVSDIKSHQTGRISLSWYYFGNNKCLDIIDYLMHKMQYYFQQCRSFRSFNVKISTLVSTKSNNIFTMTLHVLDTHSKEYYNPGLRSNMY